VHTRLRVRGWGSPNSDDWRKSLALCLLCAVDEAGCDCRALDLLDSTVVDTSLDINRGMWMQKVSRGALDLLDSTVVGTSLDTNRGMWKQKVSGGALDLLDPTCGGRFDRHKPWYLEAKRRVEALDQRNSTIDDTSAHNKVRRQMVRRGSVGSASACWKAGPSSIPGSAPQGGLSH
jgi:hypothetical protein